MSSAAIFLFALAMSFLPDAIALPRSVPPWQRNAAALATHAFSVATIFLLTLAMSTRPLFAGFMALSLTALLAVVSNAKYASLREPLVFTDLSLFSQLFRHPRMYLPFLSVASVLALGIGVAVFLCVLVLSKPLPDAPRGLLLAGAAASALIHALAARALPLTIQPGNDQRRHGFYAVFVAGLLNGLRPSTAATLRTAMGRGPFSRTAAPTTRPDVIVIQSESFFDARRLGPEVHADLLPNFDAVCAEALQYGQLEVPAWGANTMRTEFALLSGLDAADQGYARFYPYAYIRQPCASLAGWFGRAGYRTVAIHPYHGDFFGRQRVLPLLHFDRFLDIRHFDGAQRAGPYVADLAVADAIQAQLEAAGDSPAFVMAMTIENHGPLHLEHVAPGEGAPYHAFGEGKPWDDLTAYLRHLVNADAMIGQLRRYLAGRKRPAILCFYGDHVPALSAVYRQAGVQPMDSDYLVWRSDAANTPTPRQKRVRARIESLGQLLIDSISAPLPASHGAGASRTNTANTEN
ncbi:LTA synthase family protein [Ralstonia pickettii]|uniref:LTA synthase family protein n=1 Tax=Ralstonia pickettii TaxID=329 RepID=UPI0008188E14|nr:LTA synthase family protein [Ralstonia pickettii]OCS47900.1 capsular biosynthesis protein [Ralstonia pickettii]